ncbi:MAG TPA: RnfH family protein [Nevskiaceae bacterium]|nr:RnfH family protein [Nevskiaceae bacterium]
MESVRLRVEVCCALPRRQFLVGLQVPQGTTLQQAVELSGVRDEFPQLDWNALSLGVHGRARRPEEALREGDRVEIYRPLTADPKTARRERAAGARRKPG